MILIMKISLYTNEEGGFLFLYIELNQRLICNTVGHGLFSKFLGLSVFSFFCCQCWGLCFEKIFIKNWQETIRPISKIVGNFDVAEIYLTLFYGT